MGLTHPREKKLMCNVPFVVGSMAGTLGLMACMGLSCVAVAPAEARTWVVAQAHPAASDEGQGTAEAPFRTIGPAAERAEAGDTVRVHEGIYRERVAPARSGEGDRPITYEAAEGERVVVRGSEVFAPDWQAVDGRPGVYIAELDVALYGDEVNPFAQRVRGSRGRGTLGQVFVNAERLSEVLEEPALHETPGTWLAMEDGTRLAVHFPQGVTPEAAEVELSVRHRVFAPHRRGLKHIHVRRFIFEHAANPVSFPQMGMVSTRTGEHWVFERNVVRHARGIGFDFGGEYGIWGDRGRGEHNDQGRLEGVGGHHLIRHNVFADNEQCGLAGWRCPETRVIGNIIKRNGLRVPGYESGGLKTHLMFDGHVEGNLVRDNGAWGIWLDTGYQGARVTRNLVINNRSSGIFLELGQGQVLVDHNIVLNTRGSGIYSHDASDVVLAHNLVAHSEGHGIYMHIATNRGSDASDLERSATSRQRLYNNVLIDNRKGLISLPAPAPRAEDNRSDHNVFAPGEAGELTMLVNDNNGESTGADAIAVEARRAFERTGDPGLGGEIEQLQGEGAEMGLEQWQAFMQLDQHSTIAPATQLTFDAPSHELVLTVGPAWREVTVRPIEGIEHDYHGRPLGAAPMPGPFQGLEPGEHRLKLWPVEGIGALPEDANGR